MVSVIIPTYNRMGTLERSVESVLKQTYDNFELLIIDDGSTDGTEDYVRGLEDERIRYHRNESNMGPSASRNKGAALAKGEYLAFQDSDDEWKADKLEKTLAVLEQSCENVGMVYHEMQEQSDVGDLIPSRSIPLANKEGQIFDYMLLYPLIGIPAAVIKKSCFEAIGGFSEEIKSFEDYEFFLRMAKRYEIAFVQEPLILIYDTPGSVNKQYKNKIDAELYILKNEYEALRSYDILQKKIELIRLQADNYGCEDYFYERVFVLCKEVFSPEQAEVILSCVHKSAMRFSTGEMGDRSAYYQNASEQIERLVISLSRLQANVRANMQVLVQNKVAIYEALLDVLNDLKNYTDLALYPQKEKDELTDIEGQLLTSANSVPIISGIIDAVLLKGKDLLKQIGAARCVCSACGKQVRFLPLSSYQRKVREHWGYTDANIQYLFEDVEKDRCPVCGATGQIRFLLGFLEDVQPEGEEKLAIGCVHPQGENYDEMADFVQRYSMLRDYMEYKTDVFSGDIDQKMDVLIVADVFDGEDDLKRLQEVRDKLADNGICILLVSAMAVIDEVQASESAKKTITGPGDKYMKRCYTKGELEYLAEQAGFEMQVADQNWFGTEYYVQYGLGEAAKLFILNFVK